MCIIIDANRLGHFLREPPNEDALPIRNWLERKGGVILYSTGGKFAKEVGKKAREKLRVYSQAGKAVEVDHNKFNDDERDLESVIRSDDPHVLAMARATGVRLLYTVDRDLIADFKNKELIDDPRGKVYTSTANANLLTKSVCMRQ